MIKKNLKIGTRPQGLYQVDGRCTIAPGRVIRARPDTKRGEWDDYLIREIIGNWYLKVDYSYPGGDHVPRN